MMTIFETVLKQNAIPFLKDPQNVLVVGEKVFAHDRTTCMGANIMQQYCWKTMISISGEMTFGQEIRQISAMQIGSQEPEPIGSYAYSSGYE